MLGQNLTLEERVGGHPTPAAQDFAALMAQSIASFGAGGASDNTSASPLGSGPLDQQPQIVTANNQPLVHS